MFQNATIIIMGIFSFDFGTHHHQEQHKKIVKVDEQLTVLLQWQSGREFQRDQVLQVNQYFTVFTICVVLTL